MAKTVGDIPLHGLRFKGRRFDCGTKIGFVSANVAFAAARDDLRGDIREVLKDII
jgi:UTP--glucose-1-phosphate uridylyltransferase